MESAIELNHADYVVDLVETGETMRVCGLEVLDEIMESECVVVCNRYLLFFGFEIFFKFRVSFDIHISRQKQSQKNDQKTKIKILGIACKRVERMVYGFVLKEYSVKTSRLGSDLCE